MGPLDTVNDKLAKVPFWSRGIISAANISLQHGLAMKYAYHPLAPTATLDRTPGSRNHLYHFPAGGDLTSGMHL